MSGEWRFHQLSAELTCDYFLAFTASRCPRSLWNFLLSLALLFFISHLWQLCLRRITKRYALFIISRASAIGPSVTSPPRRLPAFSIIVTKILYYFIFLPYLSVLSACKRVSRLLWHRVFPVTHLLSLVFSTCLCCWCHVSH